ncbi:hypothetical protein [Streptococcus suis]|uniref:hypothetical protein n=1 Tax=Streptococcus suis TaxID=1307 RepID=UPI000CF5838C|nr:hypothetical protein [Streptococcus suis]
MNKRQKKKRLKREKKEVIKGIDYIEGVFTKVAKEMREHFETLPDNREKVYNDFFITGFEFSLKQLALAKYLLEQIK